MWKILRTFEVQKKSVLIKKRVFPMSEADPEGAQGEHAFPKLTTSSLIIHIK